MYFIYSAAMLLLITAASKIISARGNAHILLNTDPIFLISFRHLFYVVGLLEILVAFVCLYAVKVWMRVALLAWLASGFAMYRIGLLWIGYHRPCPCLGNLTDALHISPDAADTAMKIILAYLLIGSYASLFWLGLQKRKANQVS